MESLAVLAATIVSAIYLSSLLAFGFSWIKNKVGKILTLIFASIGIISGLWIGITLLAGNGIFIGGIALLISLFAIWNTFRRNKLTN